MPAQAPNPFAAFMLVAARAGLGALGGTPPGASSSSKGKKQQQGGGCTPCAAQARKDAARAFVRAGRGQE